MLKVNHSNEKIVIPSLDENINSIFLAGPIPRDKNILSWRVQAIEMLRKLDFDGIIYVPEYSTGVARKSYVDQAMWEREGLDNATCIVFWVPRELKTMPAFTTNVEFGEYVSRRGHRVAYGRPEGAPKTKYLDWFFDYKQKREPNNTLEDTLKEAIKIASEKRILNMPKK